MQFAKSGVITSTSEDESMKAEKSNHWLKLVDKKSNEKVFENATKSALFGFLQKPLEEKTLSVLAAVGTTKEVNFQPLVIENPETQPEAEQIESSQKESTAEEDKSSRILNHGGSHKKEKKHECCNDKDIDTRKTLLKVKFAGKQKEKYWLGTWDDQDRDAKR